jgi:hypothetical protein
MRGGKRGREGGEVGSQRVKKEKTKNSLEGEKKKKGNGKITDKQITVPLTRSRSFSCYSFFDLFRYFIYIYISIYVDISVHMIETFIHYILLLILYPI